MDADLTGSITLKGSATVSWTNISAFMGVLNVCLAFRALPTLAELVYSKLGSQDSNSQGKTAFGLLYSLEICSKEFDRVLSVGPSFKIEGQAKATLDIDVDMTVDLSYSVQGAKLFFPASQNHASGGNFVPGQTRKLTTFIMFACVLLNIKAYSAPAFSFSSCHFKGRRRSAPCSQTRPRNFCSWRCSGSYSLC